MTIYFEIVGPYIAALMMSLGALCVFIWGVLSGAFRGADDASIRFTWLPMYPAPPVIRIAIAIALGE